MWKDLRNKGWTSRVSWPNIWNVWTLKFVCVWLWVIILYSDTDSEKKKHKMISLSIIVNLLQTIKLIMKLTVKRIFLFIIKTIKLSGKCVHFNATCFLLIYQRHLFCEWQRWTFSQYINVSYCFYRVELWNLLQIRPCLSIFIQISLQK